MNTVTLTIKRPNGEVEVVDVSEKFTGMNEALFTNIKKATKASGRGEVLSYEVIEPELTDEDKARIAENDHEARIDEAVRNHNARRAVSLRR